ncbi:GNAT family N-acetyltransferase [uncultured Robinsoniella sp.]|uniref:GNAT family N-acetyltransferase n=1 Tax=uncultured Robinsoniella sp. TaxID=904190 RepID=UPI00374F1B28
MQNKANKADKIQTISNNRTYVQKEGKGQYHFERITDLNLADILHLQLPAEQRHFIETPLECLKEAEELHDWQPRGIYHKEQLIGFTMYGEILSEQRVWMDRFLIDQKYQGQGHGKKALSGLIQHLFDKYSCKEIYLSLYPDNQRAFALYCNLGFDLNGELDTKGEQIMVLKKRKWEINRNNQNIN